MQRVSKSCRLTIIAISLAGLATLWVAMLHAQTLGTNSPDSAASDFRRSHGRDDLDGACVKDRPRSLDERLARLGCVSGRSPSDGRDYAAAVNLILDGDEVLVIAMLKDTKYLTSAESRDLREMGATVTVRLSSVVEAWVPISELRRLATFESVGRLEPPRQPVPLGG